SFFFQAEDGIRDATVTGVQTCALPISGPSMFSAGLFRNTVGLYSKNMPFLFLRQLQRLRLLGRVRMLIPQVDFQALYHTFTQLRSEERRVGKECRCR